MRPFHLAFPVHDLEAARAFYAGTLGCETGREADTWIDFNLFGHQIVAHLDSKLKDAVTAGNAVDGDHVPVPHFGVLLTPEAWRKLRDRLKTETDINWIIEPKIRFEGEPGEQATMFLSDPSGNALEFKSFADDGQIFAK
ncbi:MAG: VOC family protein [Pseudomonadota bacterium]